MPYVVVCRSTRYGPFDDSQDAARYAGWLDMDDGACDDQPHEIDYIEFIKKPLTFDELKEAAAKRKWEQRDKNVPF